MKINRKFRTKMGVYHLSLFSIIFFSLFVPTLIIGTILTALLFRQEVTLIRNDMENSLNLAYADSEGVFSDIETVSFHFCGQDQIRQSFITFKEDANRQKNIFVKIQEQKNLDSNIDDILYYNPRNEMTVSANYGGLNTGAFDYYRGRLAQISDFTKENSAGWDLVEDGRLEDGYIYSFIRLVPMLPDYNYGGFISFDLSAARIRNHLAPYKSTNFPGEIYTFSENRELIASTERDPEKNARFCDYLLPELEGLDERSGFALSLAPSSRYVYCYIPSPSGRLYVYTIPAKFVRLKLVGRLGVLLFGLVLIGILYYFISMNRSRNLSGPIVRLAQQSEKIIGEMKAGEKYENEVLEIQACIEELISQIEAVDKYTKVLEHSTEAYDIRNILSDEPAPADISGKWNDHFDRNTIFQVVIFQVQEIDQKIWENEQDRGLAMDIIKGAVTDQIKQDGKSAAYSCVFTEKMQCRVLVYYNIESLGSEGQDRIGEFAAAVCRAAKGIDFCVIAGIGKPCHNFEDVNLSCAEAAHALTGRMFLDSDVLAVEEVENLPSQKEKIFPDEAEKRIIHALRSNDLDMAATGLRDFSTIVVHSNDFEFVRLSFLILCIEIIKEHKNQGGELVELTLLKAIKHIQNLYSTDRIEAYFIDTLFPYYIRKMSEERPSSGKAAVEKIIEYISSNLPNDVSLTQCAEQMHMSPSYISHIFKKETGISFLEYTMHIRIEKVKNLLVNTDWPINKIADQIGYSPRSLYRFFQQYEGMSPNDYRKQNRG